MITLSTYISVLIPSILTILGFYITIQTSQNIDKKKKNKLIIFIFSLLILIFLLLTILYCYQRYSFDILYLTKIFPFFSQYFEDLSFFKTYIIILCISLGMSILIYWIKMKFDCISFKIYILSFLIFLSLFIFLITAYLYIWGIYWIMIILFNEISILLIYCLTISISFVISILFSIIGCHINESYFNKHASSSQIEQSLSLLSAKMAENVKKLEELKEKINT